MSQGVDEVRHANLALMQDCNATSLGRRKMERDRSNVHTELFSGDPKLKHEKEALRWSLKAMFTASNKKRRRVGKPSPHTKHHAKLVSTHPFSRQV